MLRLLVITCALFLLGQGDALASEASASNQQLLGWSDDGTTWAVSTTPEDQGDDELLVYKQGKVVLTLCLQEDEESECQTTKKTKTVKREVTKINIETHKYLKQYRLKRVSKSWRTTFKKAYLLKGIHFGKSWNGKRCGRGWTVNHRATKKVLASHKESTGCARSLGGYVHPNGKTVLVKQEHGTWSTGDDEFWTDDSKLFVAVALAAP
jgi:hypothetical protein